MKAAAIALAFVLSGCAAVNTGLSSANNALANLANNQLPAACGIVNKASSYYLILEANISEANRAKYAKARAVADAICNNPPTDITSALGTLAVAWFAMQNATVTK